MAFKTDYIQIDGSINIDGSIFQFGEPFTSGVSQTYVDTSLLQYLKEASLNMSTFTWNIGGQLEPSVAGNIYAVDNGLIEESAQIFRLGGTLVKDTSIALAYNSLEFHNDDLNARFRIYSNSPAQILSQTTDAYTILTHEGFEVSGNTGTFKGIHYSQPFSTYTPVDGQSVPDIDWINTRVDGSLNVLATYIKSASTGTGLYWNAGLLDVSITSGISQEYIDGSLATYIKSSSTGTGLYWNGGLLDVSVEGGGVSQEYVDGSLAVYIKSSSTGIGLYWNAGLLDVSVAGGGVSQAYVDGSLLTVNSTFAQYIKSSSLGPTLKWTPGAGLFDISVNLANLSDVTIASASDNDVLSYDTATSHWINRSMVDISTISEDASLYFQTRLFQSTKLSNDAGEPGQWSFDASYLYICTSTNKWMRILGVSGY